MHWSLRSITISNETRSYSCDQVALCVFNGVCACAAEGCTAARETSLSGAAQLSLELDGDQLKGRLIEVGEFDLRLTRL